MRFVSIDDPVGDPLFLVFGLLMEKENEEVKQLSQGPVKGKL